MTEPDSTKTPATISTAIELGIRVFDTAYGYGLDGEADRYLAVAIRGESDRFHVISKVGQRYLPDGKRVVDQIREVATAGPLDVHTLGRMNASIEDVR